MWIIWWQNPSIPTDLQMKDTKMAPNRWFLPTVFVYLTKKNIGVMGRRPSVLLSRSLCHTLRSLKKKKVYQISKNLLIGANFKAQSTAIVYNVLSKQGIESIMVPKNMAHFLQLFDLTANASLKIIEKRAFSKRFVSSILEALKEDPTREVTTIKVGLRLSALRPLHANVMEEAEQFFKSLKGKEVILNWWAAAGITESLWQTREKNENSVNLNPLS